MSKLPLSEVKVHFLLPVRLSSYESWGWCWCDSIMLFINNTTVSNVVGLPNTYVRTYHLAMNRGSLL